MSALTIRGPVGSQYLPCYGEISDNAKHANCRCEIPEAAKNKPPSIDEMWGIWNAMTSPGKTQSPYVRYHEIGNRPEKDLDDTRHTNEVLGLLRVGAISSSQARESLGLPKQPSPDMPDSSFGYINRVSMREIASAFAMTPAELGVTEKPKPAPRTYPYPFGQSLMDFEKTAKACGCAECQEYLKSPKENNDMEPYTIRVDLSNISSQSSSPVSGEQLNLKTIAELTKNDPDFARKVKETAEKAEREHKESIQQALKSVNFLAMKQGHSGRDFCISFWKGDAAYSLDGTDYAYGQHIAEDDIDDENRVFVSGSVWPASGTYATMDRLKQRLERAEILYVIEYYPDQD